ncbi:MAG TPA: type IV secretory system conjugative DNA transfer family protein, partial [Saprospiraceae bacterium]|nr:type IV secretory system conjugative DNA transfer family protein [Saprospiraceae bacterium]
MRSNQHIGFLHYKWGIISLVSMLIYIPAINLVLDLLSHLHRFNFENAGNFNNYSFRQAMKIQWMGLKPFFYVGLSYVIIVNIFKLLASLIDERIRKVEELAILPLFLSLLYSGYLCFVNATNLSENNVKNIGSEDGAFLYGLLVFLTAVLVLFIKIGGCLKFCEFISGLYEIPITIKGSGFYRRRYSQGFGGTADWANFKTFRKKEVKFNSQPPSTEGFLTSDIILGKSLFDDDPNPRLVGIKDDAHCITVAMTGSGKTTTVLNTNLAVYDASIYVFDPKGEFAKNTFERRCNDPCIYSPLKYRMNGNAFLLDPFNETLDSLPHSFYNPLTEIDLTSDKMMDVISAISDGCVVSSSNEKDPHWNEWAKNLIEALIIHVISAYPKDKHNLPFVLDLFTGMETYITEDINEKKLSRFDELLIDMIMNESAGGIVKQTATLISSMGSEEKGAVLSTTYRNMKWVGDPAMRKQLSNSSPFLISNLKNQKITVYMVLDSNMIKSQMRWVRIL